MRKNRNIIMNFQLIEGIQEISDKLGEQITEVFSNVFKRNGIEVGSKDEQMFCFMAVSKLIQTSFIDMLKKIDKKD